MKLSAESQTIFMQPIFLAAPLYYFRSYSEKKMPITATMIFFFLRDLFATISEYPRMDVT